ncbi:DUF4214 domain-containing protein [Pseudomonas sp. 21LCFQ02]|uniref:DUF4214 domain-containing protein n=1 Tax=Pseudomonas sp. 21LCFQ02 TaxID=2957505 RepID=UPI00209B6FF8|nr:DUF4214 domain-containing protein [Pseudomonas sp. 21LCFQ02]MCO8170999.1 DUF4214 domain-containing protein [Pseudomonas sp. 21LCFQ02]
MATTSAQVQQLYVAYLGRAADKGGLDYWLGQLNATPATITLDQIRANFVNDQPEYAAAYAGLSRSETVSKIYLNLFGRPADAGGLAYWTTGGGASVAADQLLVAFINGASATDAQTVANKVIVSEVYTATAGSAYTQADAVEVLNGVSSTPASVTAALAKLSDGSLAGVAIPAGVALLKADAAADAAVTAYEASKVASLKALNDKVVALNADYSIGLTAIVDGGDDGSVAGDSYSEVAVAITNAKTLRDGIAGGSTVTTAQLELNATQATAKVAEERAALVNVSATAATDITAYNNAVAANNALTAPSTAKVQTDTGALQGVIGANAANGTAFSDASTAYTTAGGTATITTAAELYTALSTANATELARLDAAFNTGVFTSAYANLRADGVAQAAKTAAESALTAAEGKVGTAYVNAAEASAAAAKLVTDVKAADALVAEATAETNAHDAVVKVASDAQDAVDAITTGASAYATNVTASTGVTPVDGSAKADLFFFTNTTHSNDFIIGTAGSTTAAVATQFAKGDAIYLGEGYTFNSGALSTGNNNVKEVFFIQGSAGVQVVVESTVAGSTNATTAANGDVTTTTNALDTTTVITLTGVTDVAQLSFANGVVSHV